MSKPLQSAAERDAKEFRSYTQEQIVSLHQSLYDSLFEHSKLLQQDCIKHNDQLFKLCRLLIILENELMA